MKSGMTSVRLLATLLMVLGFAPETFAQTTLSDQEKYLEPIKTSGNVAAYTFNSFGESTNLQDGSTSFSWTDIDIKGNNALPVRFQRKFAIENTFHGGGDRVSTLNEFGGDGHGDMPSLDIPYLKGTYAADGWVVNTTSPNARCTLGGSAPPAYSDGIFQPHDYWNGNWMHIPWVGEQEMLRNPATSIRKSGSAPLMTKNMWAFACLPTTKNGYPGEGFIAISPTGEKYYFDWVVTSGAEFKKWYSNYGHGQAALMGSEVYFFVTRIEDRFGNWVAYSYSGDKLTGIDSSDGRYIHITGRVDGAISTVESSIGTWHYATNNTTNSHQLLVTLPDQSQSVYFGTGMLDIEPADDPPYYDEHPDCIPPSTGIGQYEFSVVLPSGAMADYQFDVQRHWISNVRKMCNAFTDGQLHSVQFLTVPNFHDNFTLTTKTVSGPSLPTSAWTYTYPNNGPLDFQAFEDVCDNPPYPNSCPPTSKTIVNGPGGSYKTYTFGKLFQVNSGQLLGIEEGYATGKAPNLTYVPLRTTQNTYVSDAETAQAQFPSVVGDPSWVWVDTVGRSLLRPLKATSITQDGVTFSWQVPSTCNGSNTLCFDLHARALTAVKSSTLGYSRTETTTYSDNATKWILGLVTQVKCVAPTTALPAGCGSSGTVISETTYDSTYGLPLVSKSFGKVQQTLTYNFTTGDQDGTLKTIKDGNNNVTTLGSWKRGIPQVITYPATPDQPTPVTLSASVNDSGWVTSVMDENRYPTGYGYDAMGRLASIVYPQEDNGAGATYKKWNDTTIAYQAITAAEYGIPGGHWKRTESTGNSRKVTYYDALWRPLVEQQYDTADSANTASFTVKRYDASGRVAFQGYPQAGLTDYAAVAAGSTTTYDALDRVLKVSVPSADSSTGIFVTTTAYLTGFKTQVTNPRTYKTITSFMAFEQPTTEYPVDIDQADGQTTEADTDIARDVFGKPTAITRHNPSNSLSETRRYVYDDGQRLCKTVEPETGATVMDYDGAGNVAWTAAGLTLTGLSCDRTSVPAEDQIVRAYDARNRLLSLTVSDGRGNQNWTYTPDSLPATITTANGYDGNIPVINAYHYNRRRLLDGDGDTVTEPNFFTWGIGYGWDANGHQSIQTYPSGLSVDFAPNALGQPKQAGSFVSGVTYYPNGAIKHFVYGNGIAHDMVQNDRQLPESSIDAYGTTKFLSDAYDYDPNGNVAAISDSATGRVGRGDRTMAYDSLDRLTSTASPMFGNGTSGTTSFSYDALDNLTKLSMPATSSSPARTQFYCYDSTSLRLMSLRTAANCGGSAQVTLGYDARGNVSSKDGQTFDFDMTNRLKSINNGGPIENYRYDGYGLRALKNASAGNIWSQYTHDGRLLQEINARAAIETEYIYLGGSLVANRETPTAGGATVVKYQHTDALGTPVAVTNASRTVIERSEVEPYGQLLNRAQHDGPGFTGHVQDAMTGLTYMQQRYYDPMIGRFLSVDPVTATSVGGNFNRYWYANNNPYRFVDPDGRCTGSMFSHGDGTCLGSGGFTTQSYVRSAGPIGNLETSRSSASTRTASTDTPWINSAATQLGQTEISGESANQQIVNYLATTTFPSKSDETAWCSAFVNWSFSKAGIAGTNSASALSWSTWGEKLSRPAFGSVAVIDWGHGNGHVGFVIGISRTGRIALLGGNQADSVKISYFSPSLVKAYVYPTGLTPSYVLPTISGGDPAGFLNTR